MVLVVFITKIPLIVELRSTNIENAELFSTIKLKKNQLAFGWLRSSKNGTCFVKFQRLFFRFPQSHFLIQGLCENSHRSL
jgi:hypothetical protein